MSRVVLLHGLARTRASMLLPGRSLQRAGFQVRNVGYPSRRASIEALAERVMAKLADLPAPFHAVTHSMGGILVRVMAQDPAFAARLGRVVMLGPPNGGSELVDRLGALAPFGWINGPAGRALATRPHALLDDLPARLGPVRFECGVIAGTKPLTGDLAALLPAPHDGKVSVASTRVEGMVDHLALPVGHTFMMNDARVLAASVHFLRHGRFAKG